MSRKDNLILSYTILKAEILIEEYQLQTRKTGHIISSIGEYRETVSGRRYINSSSILKFSLFKKGH